VIITAKHLKDPAAQKGWVQIDNQYEFTTNKEVISKEVKKLVEDRIWIEIRLKGYKSTPTLVISADENELEIDKPRDWPGAQDITLIYRHVTGPWHFLQARVKDVSKQAIWTYLPYAFVILERREHFRISTASGSKIRVVFHQGEREISIIGEVIDISLGGVAFWVESKKDTPLPSIRSMVDLVELELKLDASTKWKDEKIVLTKAEVVRVDDIRQTKGTKKRIALKFHSPIKEIDQLWPYIRQRELLLLKT